MKRITDILTILILALCGLFLFGFLYIGIYGSDSRLSETIILNDRFKVRLPISKYDYFSVVLDQGFGIRGNLKYLLYTDSEIVVKSHYGENDYLYSIYKITELKNNYTVEEISEKDWELKLQDKKYKHFPTKEVIDKIIKERSENY